MPDKLTARQTDILGYITSSIVERGFPPTLREIGSHFGIKSTNGVSDHLKALEKKGHLRREDLKSRAMRPVALDPVNGGADQAANDTTKIDTGKNNTGMGEVVPLGLRMEGESIEVPILGRVAAGAPILAVEHIEDTVRVDKFFLNGHKQGVFGLRVVGDSMIEDGIFDGDFIFVKKTQSAAQGEIVVAMIEGEATVKRFYPEADRIRLQPANSNMKPIYVNRKDFRSIDIIGIVVGVYRKM